MSQVKTQHRRPQQLCGVIAAVMSLGLVSAVGPGSLNGPSQAHGFPLARAARAISLNASGHLHLTSKHGYTLNEQGSATGTVRGTIFVHLTIVSTKRVTAEVNIYPPGGSISGHASANYQRGGSFATFSGSMTVNRGSGSYAHAQGSGLSFSGTIQRSNDAVSVHVSGTVTE
jgi:hypothetical protein